MVHPPAWRQRPRDPTPRLHREQDAAAGHRSPTPGTFPAKKQEGEVAIQIPYSKSHAPRYYNHITDTGMRALLNCIKDDFDIDVWEYLHDFGKIGRQQKDLIYLFMEQRGILEDGTCWDAIAKSTSDCATYTSTE